MTVCIGETAMPILLNKKLRLREGGSGTSLRSPSQEVAGAPVVPSPGPDLAPRGMAMAGLLQGQACTGWPARPLESTQFVWELCESCSLSSPPENIVGSGERWKEAKVSAAWEGWR